ncbi:hypothetical protein ACFQLX_08030 [Streptomyces polyrhachis]|uniref:Uncharacterized protein n=1 Tax=Streptomyces polyrhachis TaxID=1282885 RepID=A0ABW2GEG9_9ACTN
MTTFEDRLLDELKQEITARGPRPDLARAASGRRVAAVAAVAAGAAVVGTFAVQGLGGGSAAYAVQEHPDGTVTVTVPDITPDRAEQAELAERLRALDVRVSIDTPAADSVCAWPRGEAISPLMDVHTVSSVLASLVKAQHEQGQSGVAELPIHPGVGSDQSAGAGSPEWSATLAPGDTLLIENVLGGSYFSAVKGTAKPCEPIPWQSTPGS